MKKVLLLSIVLVGFLVCSTFTVNAQGVGINSSGTPADPSSILDVSSANKGALMPRMTTTQRDAIANPVQGLVIYNTTTNCFNYYTGATWFILCGNCSAPAAPTVSNNGPHCIGATLILSASTVSGVTYSWTGPNGFASTQQNPSISNVTPADGGTYSVTASLNGCSSSPQTTVATINTFSGSGGAITQVNGNTIHTFTTSGTFTANCSGNVQVLVVAGGGGGGTVTNGAGGGGGGGGVIYNSSYALTSGQSVTVTVGDGGAVNTQGVNSAFGTITATGGGAGGNGVGGNGGSGGGGGVNSAGGSGIPGQGYNGAAGNGCAGANVAGGGGGAGGTGSMGVCDSHGGNGGNGLSFSISGTPAYYGGGGGGGSQNYSNNTLGGTGGLGGGGNGFGNASGNGSAGVPNTGGGGGGAGAGGPYPGGSGIVIVSYLTPCTLPPASPTAGTHSPSATQIVWNWNTSSGAAGYKYNTVDNYSTATDNGTNTSYTQTGLTCNTANSLYIWAYNSCGNSPSTALNQATSACPFPCGNNLTDSRDGKTYGTVLIGSQCWMQQNMDYGTRINGSLDQTNNGVAEKYCFDNDNNNCAIYGGLYKWGEMVQYFNGATNTTSWNPIPTGNVQGICPTGWHIPTDAEICTLENTVEAGTDPGCSITAYRGVNTTYYLKITSSNNPPWNGNNSSGFSALPAGDFWYNGTFGDPNSTTFWTATEGSATTAWIRVWGNDGRSYRDYGYGKSAGFSVRCLLD